MKASKAKPTLSNPEAVTKCVNMLETITSPVRLELLGGALLHVPEGKVWKLERKTAALLTYLTLEGDTTRSRLAGLLWPDSIESTARNNLSQVARRLREGAGIGLLSGDDRLSLNPALHVDVAQLELETFTGNDAAVLGFTGVLLEGLDYDDCAEFQDWLLIKREAFLGLRRDAHLRLSQAAEVAGQSRLALEHASSVLELDPISEVAHRHVMRLHYQHGDRGAALLAFERCKQVLEQELGVPPLPETLALAEAISQGMTLQEPVSARSEIPLSVLRPPMLIGREHEWQQLETAWNQGLQIVICGEPGIGKSRLLFDFVAHHGKFVLLEGRPGDTNVPFSSYARSLGRWLNQYPSLELEDWVRTELSRLLPGLGRHAPAPLENQEEKLRFFQAIACTLETISQQQILGCMVADDLQFMDAASLEAQEYVVTHLTLTGLRFLNAYRTNELPESLENSIQTAIGSGTTQRIELKALGTDQVSHWIASLEIESLEIESTSKLGARLVKHTGGNPMFMLETIKSLIETGQLSDQTPLPTPNRVGTLVRQRLERLKPNALRLARVAAIAGTDYSLPLAAKILETNAMDLNEVAGELEQAQLMVGERFAHDLIFEAVQANTPQTIKTFLHFQIAKQLEETDVAAAQVAYHWLAANQSIKAIPFLEQAANQAAKQYQLRDVVKYASQAAEILEQAGKIESAWKCWMQAREVLRQLAIDAELETVIKALHRTAITARQRAESLEAECDMWIKRGDLDQALQIAEKSMTIAEDSGFLALQLAENNLGTIYSMQGQNDDAADHYTSANKYGGLLLEEQINLGQPEDEIAQTKHRLADGLGDHAMFLDDLGRYAEAEALHQKAIILLRELQQPETLAQTLTNFASTLISQGRSQDALVYLNEAQQQRNLLTEKTLSSIFSHTTRGDALLSLDHCIQALESLEQAREIAQQIQPAKLSMVYGRLGTLYRILGAFDQARTFFEAAQHVIQAHPTLFSSLFQHHAVFLLERGEDATTMAQEAFATTSSEHVVRWYKTHLELLTCLPENERMPLVNKALKNPTLQSMKGLQILALTRGAQLQLGLDKHKKALGFSQQAITLLEEYEPELQRSEVLLTHQHALEANNHPDAPAHLEHTLSWLLDVADNNVPPEYRQSFLERNPHNAAILELARNAGLERVQP
jgi:DNA-binding SARP family transcriptional activator/tetratricopeptide (TPR) repeat protein